MEGRFGTGALRGTRRVGLGLALALAIGLGACGYRMAVSAGPLPGGARSLYVPLFKNRTAEPGVEGVFTEALRELLAREGREGGAGADAVLEGEVVEIVGGPAVFTPGVVGAGGTLSLRGGVASYRTQGRAVLRVRQGARVLKEVQVSGGEDYLPGESPEEQNPNASSRAILDTEGNRRVALRRLARSLMAQAYDRLTVPEATPTPGTR